MLLTFTIIRILLIKLICGYQLDIHFKTWTSNWVESNSQSRAKVENCERMNQSTCPKSKPLRKEKERH